MSSLNYSEVETGSEIPEPITFDEGIIHDPMFIADDWEEGYDY